MLNIDIPYDESTVTRQGERHRIEWSALRHHPSYHPGCAFDLELEWIIATGGLLNDMVSIKPGFIYRTSVLSNIGSLGEKPV